MDKNHEIIVYFSTNANLASLTNRYNLEIGASFQTKDAITEMENCKQI